MRAIVTVALVGAIGCSSEGTDSNDLPPILEISSPQRGTFNDSDEVTVTGRVTDDQGGVTVKVGDTELLPAADGSFTATVQVEPGITVLETVAVDVGGNRVRDVRAVLAGAVEATDGSIASPLGARLGPAGLTSVGTAVGDAAEDIDFTAAAKTMNPVYNNTGCLGARIDITSVSLSNIDVGLAAKTGAIGTNVAIDNVVIRLNANYKVACVGGSTTITVRTTKARISDDLGIGLEAGKLRTSLPSPAVALDGFSVDVGGVPGAIESLLRDEARKAAERALTNVIKSRLPAIADAQLAGMIAKPFNSAVLGHDVTATVAPTKVEITQTGMFVAVDTKVAVTGGEGGTALSTPMAVTSDIIASAPALGVAVSDDLVNQLFAGLWAAGAFDMTLSSDQIGPAAAILDDDVRTLDVKMSLPPTVTAVPGKGLELALGDLIITGKDSAGADVQRIALSLRTALVAGPTTDNKLTLTTTTPTVFVQVLAESAVVDSPLDAMQLEGIVAGVWGLVGGMANDALGKLPMPKVAGIQLGAPTVIGQDGFVVLDVGVQ